MPGAQSQQSRLFAKYIEALPKWVLRLLGILGRIRAFVFGFVTGLGAIAGVIALLALFGVDLPFTENSNERLAQLVAREIIKELGVMPGPLVTFTPPATTVVTVTPTPIGTVPPTRPVSPAPPLTATPPAEGLVRLEDQSKTLRITVPGAWSDVDTSPLEFSNDPAIKAAPNLAALESRSGPGVEFTASPFLLGFGGIEPLLDFVGSDVRLVRCTYEGRFDYQRAPYAGKFDKWTECGGPLTDIVVLAAMPPDGSFVAVVEVLMASEADRQALDTILNSWEVLTGSDGG